MKTILIRNGLVVNEGMTRASDLLIENGRIKRIAPVISQRASIEIDAGGNWVLPGMIDDQVHFREPGFPHKGTIKTESMAAVAGGITSYMDMPNTNPPTLCLAALEEKKRIAAKDSVANYAFHFGVSNDNLDVIAALEPETVSGVKVFMGASTGNMLVDDPLVLDRLFSVVPCILLAHCENAPRIREREAAYRTQYGDSIDASLHAEIRDRESCLMSSSFAIELAKKHGTRLHVLHVTTEEELSLFGAGASDSKRITAEVCVHHLMFSRDDYDRLGNRIKCNPSIKEKRDRDALRRALLCGRLDVIGTDHAPHALSEKGEDYWRAASGLPLVQHALPALMELVEDGIIPLELMVKQTSHAVADIFRIRDRGYIREGYWADIAIVGPAMPGAQALYSRCGWSPFTGSVFRNEVLTTIVSGQVAWHRRMHQQDCMGMPMMFNRNRD